MSVTNIESCIPPYHKELSTFFKWKRLPALGLRGSVYTTIHEELFGSKC